jgi:hypothetical protein
MKFEVLPAVTVNVTVVWVITDVSEAIEATILLP